MGGEGGGNKRSGGWQHGSGGGGKNKKGKFYPASNKHGKHHSNDEIPKGVRGFLVTCPGGYEGKTSREVINVLNEFYEEAYKKEDEGAKGDAGSIDKELEKELAELKQADNAIFKRQDSGVKAQIFIKMSDKAEGAPTTLALSILRQVAATKQSKTRNVMRLLPVENTCYVAMDDLKTMAAALIAPHFPADESKGVVKYAVQFEHRASNVLKRDDVIREVASLVPIHHKVDLGAPDKTILVQVIKNVCAVAVVDDYVALAKYNLQTLCMSEEDLEARKAVERAAQAARKAAMAGAAAPAAAGAEGVGEEAPKEAPKPDSDEKKE